MVERIVPDVVKEIPRIETPRMFHNNGAFPLWKVTGKSEGVKGNGENGGNEHSAAASLEKSFERALGDSSLVISIRKVGLGETVFLVGGEESVTVYRQTDNDDAQGMIYGTEYFGDPRVDASYKNGCFSFSVRAEKDSEPYFQEEVSSETAETDGYLLVIGKTKEKRQLRYRYHNGIVLQNSCLEGSKEYGQVKSGIKATLEELENNTTNENGIYYEELSDLKGYLLYTEIHCRDTEIVEEVRTEIESPKVFVAYANGWRYRHEDSHWYHLHL